VDDAGAGATDERLAFAPFHEIRSKKRSSDQQE
jgi:hypothetical protein